MSADSGELLRVEGLSKFFPVTSGVFGKTVGHVRAVDDVSFTLGRGETLGLVGESGCGKTTLGRSILRLIEPSRGRVWFDGTDITALGKRELRRYRRRMQIVFQDPFGSLNPRLRVVDIVGEAIEQHGLARGAAVEREVRQTLQKVGIPGNCLTRYPHEFSGGQRQRIGVARAIALSPELIVCDEAVSALDVSIQAQVINLLGDLRREMNLAYLFIAHDLSVVRHIADRVAVMYLGKIVELGPSLELFQRPAHPYTRALLSAIPVPDPRVRRRRLVLEGDVPSPIEPPSGCHFHPRCPAAIDRCSGEAPPVVQLDGGRRQVRCVHAEGLESESGWYEVVERRLADVATARARKHIRDVAVAVEDTERLVLPGLSPVAAASPVALEPPGSSNPEETRSSPSRLLAWVPLVALVVGLALVLLGRWLSGLVLVGVGASGISSSSRAVLPRQVARRWVCLTLGALVVLAAAASRWVEPRRRAATARQHSSWLAAEVEGYSSNVGKLPASLLDLRFRTIERFGVGEPRDPWGRPFRYARRAEGGFQLSSDGEDGVPSPDDIRLTDEHSSR